MKLTKYISCYTSNKWIPYLILSACLGLIPALSIRLRADLIDFAFPGNANSGYTFWVMLSVYILLFLFSSEGKAAQLHLARGHGISQAAAFDSMRMKKASSVSFPITEESRYHSLWSKALEAPALDEKIFQAMGDITGTGIRLSTSLAILWLVDSWTALGLLALLAVGLLLNMKLARNTESFWGRYMENMRRTNYFSDLLLQKDYAAERKLFSYDEEINRRYRTAFAKAKKENLNLGRGRFRIEAGMQLVFAVYSVVMILLLMRPLLLGRITIGMFTSAFYTAIGLAQSSSQIYASVYALAGSLKQMGSFFEFMELEEGQVPLEDCSVDAFRLESIVFSDVTFAYPGERRPVLEHVSFRLEPGRHYALVGENGCGKSTLVKLLAGLYQPVSGEIRINGKTMQSYSSARRRAIFSVVFQDFYRFPLTIRENISLCSQNPPDENRIRQVFRQLEFHPAILERESGLDSSLMQLKGDGAGLSGGEWQKLAIARCVLSESPAVILDEPNAALDPVAEASIYRAYREMLSDRTTLFISHRLGSVRMADEILVLKDGGLLAMGSHEELMENCSYYNKLFETQRELYEER